MQHPREQTSALPPITLVGRGRVGTALARAGAARAVELTHAGRDDLDARLRAAQVALLCVADAEIGGACASVVEAGSRLRFVGHTSGATPLAELAAATEAGIATFSLHPLQTIPDGDADLIGTPAAVAGSDEEALALGWSLARRLGLSPFEVPEDSRAAYHAAASMASNFLVALEESAAELLATAGIEDPRGLLTPLVLRTAANWAERGEAALTGPIARGDEKTIAAHLDALAREAPQLEPLYRALAERTASLAGGRAGATT